jgi:hypothetical protein
LLILFNFIVFIGVAQQTFFLLSCQIEHPSNNKRNRMDLQLQVAITSWWHSDVNIKVIRLFFNSSMSFFSRVLALILNSNIYARTSLQLYFIPYIECIDSLSIYLHVLTTEFDNLTDCRNRIYNERSL